MIPQIGYTDFPKICRLCLNERELINILDRADLVELYIRITNITIKATDYFPKNICLECVTKLEDVEHFVKTCQHSHDCLTAAILHQDDKEIEYDIKNENHISDTHLFDFKDGIENEDDNSGEDNLSIVMDNFQVQSDNKKNIKTGNKGNKKDCQKSKRKFRNNLFKLHMNDHCKKIKKELAIDPNLGSDKSLVESNELQFELKIQLKPRIGTKNWRCFECNKEFTKKNDLQRHLRIHTGLKPFICSICDLKFTQKSTLNRHISAIHTVDKKAKYHFECYICEKRFNRKDHLESHVVNCHIKKINEHSLENPDWKVCKDCGKSFSLFTYIKHHTIVHIDKQEIAPKLKRYKSKHPPSSSSLCSVCGKSFEKRSIYLQHMRRAHGSPIPKKTKEENAEKRQSASQCQRFQCWQCGKIKSTLCNLKVHMRIHTGEKPYECKFCFRKFSAWNSWHDHENIHLGLKPYQCEHCKKVFRQRSSLRKHLRSSVHVNQEKPQIDEKVFV